MKTLSKIVSVVALTILSLNASAQEVKKPINSDSNISKESNIDKPVSKRFEKKTQKKMTKPLNRVPARRTTVKEEAVKQ